MAGGDSKHGRAASVLLSIFMVLTVLVSSGMLLGGISVLEGTTTADVSASDNSLSNEGTVLFSDDFNDGTLNKWTLSGWNPSGLMEVTSSVSHSPNYSAHAQSDPDTNTGPYIAAGFNDTNDVLVEAWIYLPQKTQAYDIFKLLQIRTIEGGFSDISDMAAYSYYLSFELDDDNYGLDLVEGVRVDGVFTHNEHMNVLDLEPETWYKLGIRVDGGRYSMLLNNTVIYESQRYDNRSVNLVLFGDIGGSSGGWGDAYLDDVKVSEISTPRNVDLSISDSDVSLSEGNPVVGDEVTIEATVHNEPVQHSGWIKQGVVVDYNGFDPGVQYPFVLKDDGIYKMWYTGLNLPSGEIYYATSTDGKNWIDQGTAVSVPSGLIYAVAPSVLKESDGTYKMWFSCQDSSWNVRTYLATSADGINWNNQGVAVDIGPSGSPDAKYVAQAKVFVDSGLYKMYYKAYDDNNIPSIMYATSSDGYSWTKQGVVMSLPSGFSNLEAPFVLKNSNGTYTMWYSATKDGISKIYVASSDDGVNWEQGGLNLDIGAAGELDDEWVGLPYVLKAPVSGEDWLYYTGSDGAHRRIFIATMGTQSPSDATCTVSFYLDSVSEQNLIYREDNVFVPANGETTVTASWTAVGGDHDIKVVLSDIVPTDLNLSNNRASAQISVGSPECVDLSISDSDILLSEERPADGSNLTVSATVHGDYDVQEGTTNSKVLFRDDFNDGSLSKWALSSWNPSGLMEVTSSVSHSPDYSAHAQSDPNTNTGPYIATGFNDTKNVLVEGWVYLPVKSQQYDKFNLLQVRHVDGGFTGSAEMSSNTIYYMGFQLSDDNYDVDLYEGVKVDGVWTRSTHLNVLSLEPETWYKLGIRIDDNGFSMLVDDQAVYEGERLSGDIINTVVFGDTYGSSGGWGDAYLDDVTVTAYTEGSGVVHRAADATCSVSFYLDNVSEQTLIYREDNVFVPANGETTVTASWTAVEGEHNIIVRVTDVNPSDCDMSNNTAISGISVAHVNIPPVPVINIPPGFYGRYYNLPENHSEMQGPITGLVTGDSPFNHDWYDNKYFSFERVDRNLEFGTSFFPVNEGMPGDPYYFSVHWQATLKVPIDGNYAFEMGSDDDSWLYIDGEMVMDLGGIHGMNIHSGVSNLTAGIHTLDIYFAERHTVRSGFYFSFLNDSVICTPMVNGTAFVNAHESVLFDGSDSYDPDGESLSYDWNFGDGSVAQGPSATHRFGSGNYSVVLTVSDGIDSGVMKLPLTVLENHVCLSMSERLISGPPALSLNYIGGTEWILEISVKNSGVSRVDGIRIFDSITPAFDVTECEMTQGSIGSKLPIVPGNDILSIRPPASISPIEDTSSVWDIGSLEAGESAKLWVHLSAKISSPGEYHMDRGASLYFSGHKGMEMVQQAINPVFLCVLGPSEIELTESVISGPEIIAQSTNAEWIIDIEVLNSGKTELRNVSVIEHLLSSFTLDDYYMTNGTLNGCTNVHVPKVPGDNSVMSASFAPEISPITSPLPLVWNITSLSPGQSEHLYLRISTAGIASTGLSEMLSGATLSAYTLLSGERIYLNSQSSLAVEVVPHSTVIPPSPPDNGVYAVDIVASSY